MHELLTRAYSTKRLFLFHDDLYERLRPAEERGQVILNSEHFVMYGTMWCQGVVYSPSQDGITFLPRFCPFLNPTEGFFCSWGWKFVLTPTSPLDAAYLMLDETNGASSVVR